LTQDLELEVMIHNLSIFIDCLFKFFDSTGIDNKIVLSEKMANVPKSGHKSATNMFEKTFPLKYRQCCLGFDFFLGSFFFSASDKVILASPFEGDCSFVAFSYRQRPNTYLCVSKRSSLFEYTIEPYIYQTKKEFDQF